LSGRGRTDDLLLAALAAGSPIEEAARTAGTSTRTAYRRLANPTFARRLAHARDEVLTAALGELVDYASDAITTLRSLLNASDDRIRLAAAKATLEQLLRLRETLTLGQRLAALERATEARSQRR